MPRKSDEEIVRGYLDSLAEVGLDLSPRRRDQIRNRLLAELRTPESSDVDTSQVHHVASSKGSTGFLSKLSLLPRLREAVRPTTMDNRINQCFLVLKVQPRKLERVVCHMQQRYEALFKNYVRATDGNDSQLASMYANECAELRKMAKVVLHSELALEQVTLRLETVHEFGNTAAIMVPVASVVRTLRAQLAGVLPEVSFELAEVNHTLEGLAIEVGEATETSFDISASSAESQQILQEANTFAEQRMKEQFPELPIVSPKRYYLTVTEHVISHKRLPASGIEHLSPIPLRERVKHARDGLDAQREKLEQVFSKLQQRDRELLHRGVGARVSNDRVHARMYVNECVEIRKMAKVILGSQLALEKVTMRLGTVEEFGNIMVQMESVIQIVRETTSRVAGLSPQIATELEKVNRTLLSLIGAEQLTQNLSNEAKKTLESVDLIAEEKIRNLFPDLRDAL